MRFNPTEHFTCKEQKDPGVHDNDRDDIGRQPRNRDSNWDSEGRFGLSRLEEGYSREREPHTYKGTRDERAEKWEEAEHEADYAENHSSDAHLFPHLSFRLSTRESRLAPTDGQSMR